MAETFCPENKLLGFHLVPKARKGREGRSRITLPPFFSSETKALVQKYFILDVK
jgi:hypothetical protein